MGYLPGYGVPCICSRAILLIARMKSSNTDSKNNGNGYDKAIFEKKICEGALSRP